MSDAAPTPPAEQPTRRARKTREGTVSSSGMDKTVVVEVIERVRHPRYGKTVQRTKRLVFRVPHYKTGKELAEEVAAAKAKGR